MQNQLTLEQVVLTIVLTASLQLIGFAIYYWRTRVAAAEREAKHKEDLDKQKADSETALKNQEASLQRQIADAKAENERRMTEAALIREQGHRDEQQARAEIESQLIASHNRFADEIRTSRESFAAEIKANREASAELFSKWTDVLDQMSKRQETAAQTHNRNGEKIDDLKVQIKEGFDKTDLFNGEHMTLLNNTYTHIDDAAQQVIAAVGDGNAQLNTKLASFDPVAAAVTAISGDVSEVARHVRELQTLYAEVIPKIFDSMSKSATDADALSVRFENVVTLVQRISNSVNATEGSVVKIEEHIQAIQRDLLLKLEEPPPSDEDTAQMTEPISFDSGDIKSLDGIELLGKPIPLPGSGDIPPQGGD